MIKPWGVHLEIEVKVPGEKQEDTQLEHEARVRAAGGVYFVATSPAEALARLDASIVSLVALGYPPRGAMLLAQR